MKSSGPTFRFTPFEGLRDRLKKKSVSPCKKTRVTSLSTGDARSSGQESERALFVAAMEGVMPISKERCVEAGGDKSVTAVRLNDDNDAMERLKKLVEKGEGFVVAKTPEYIEGTGYLVSSEMARRLHRGDFSIQDHIDLHGLTASDAKIVFDEFLHDSIAVGKRAVLVIHGRGLSSPVAPVLKAKVLEWITTGIWRKWVMAFSSARRCDGGAGATYVLLRRHPATKRLRRKKRAYTGNSL